jgi:hypothetical protein
MGSGKTAGNTEEFTWLNDVEYAELSQKVADCEDHWRNAGPKGREEIFSVFAVPGIFFVVCRHGHVLVMRDMIQNSEL